jgi:hypothetical protein
MPRWLVPLLWFVVLAVTVPVAIVAGIPGLVAVLAVMLGFFGWLRARQLKARGEDDAVNYTRLSDLLRPRR